MLVKGGKLDRADQIIVPEDLPVQPERNRLPPLMPP
jgi:hypothetical protein